MKKQINEHKQAISMLLQQNIPDPLSMILDKVISIFASKSKVLRLQNTTSTFVKFDKLIKAFSVDGLSTSECVEAYDAIALLRAQVEFACKGLNRQNFSSYTAHFDDENEFIHFRNVLNNVLSSLDDLDETLELMCDEEFRSSIEAIAAGDFSDFEKV